MIKSYAFLAICSVLTFTLASCGESEDPQSTTNTGGNTGGNTTGNTGNPAETITCSITTLKTISANETREYTFNYNGERIESMTTVSTFTGYPSNTNTTVYTYDTNGKVIEIVSEFGHDFFTYVGDVIMKQERYVAGTLKYKHDFAYDNSNLVSIQDYKDSGSGLVKTATIILEYTTASGKEPAVIKSYDSNGILTFTSTFTYSDHYAGTAALTDAVKKYWITDGLPVNRAVTKVVFSNGESINYTYEFNDKGYPTKRLEKYSSNPVTNVVEYGFVCH